MGTTDGFLYLSDAVLAGLGIGPDAVADSIEAALCARAEGRLWTAPKAATLPGDGRYMMATLAAADAPRALVIKSVMVSPRNPDRGLAAINGAILLIDSETGLLQAVMDANWITAVRTAGLSAVAARRLADPAAASIAFIGCGVEARSHLDAFAEMFPVKEIRAFGRGRPNIDRLCDAARDKGLAARACEDPRETLEGADLVVTSVTLDYSITPFLDARWLKPGAFATITDLALPWMPAGMPAFDTIVVDDREQEAAAPQPMVERSLVCGDLAGLVTGTLADRFAPERRSAFVFRGIAAGDFALAALAYEHARALGRGVSVKG